MALVTVDGTNYTLPADEFTAQKVTSYNSLLNAMQAAWTTWSPTWTNLSVGNGIVVARYRQIGKLVACRLSLVFGSTTSVSGFIEFSLPNTRAAYGGTDGVTPLGAVRMKDNSAGKTYEGVLLNITTTLAAVASHAVDGTQIVAAATSSTVPFTWATNDEIATEFFYEAA